MRYLEIIWEYLKTGCVYLYDCVEYAVAVYIPILAIRFGAMKHRKKNHADIQAYRISKVSVGMKMARFRRCLEEFGLILWVCLILKVTGLFDITYWELPTMAGVLSAIFRIPFLGNAFSMIVLNLLLFAPFGCLLSRVCEVAFTKNQKISVSDDQRTFGRKIFLSGLLLSVGIELIQLFSGRMFELDDIIANSFGTLLGYLIFRTMQDMSKALWGERRGQESRVRDRMKEDKEEDREKDKEKSKEKYKEEYNGKYMEKRLQNEPTGKIENEIENGYENRYENGLSDGLKNGLEVGIKKMAITVLAYGIGLFMISLVADGERIQWQEEKEYPGIDGDEAAIEDICEMRLFSPKGTYSEAGIESGDFDDAFRWMAMGIDSAMSFYSLTDDISNVPVLTDKANLKSDYIEIYYSSPHTFHFVNKKDFVMQNVQYLLYDALTGEIWYGEAFDRINGHLEYFNVQYPFLPNEDLIYIIEHGSTADDV